MKYIIEIKPEYEGTTKGIIVLGIKNNCLCVDELAIEELEELTADYINEHFGSLQDDAYKRGLEDGKWKSEDGCTGCKYEGKTGEHLPCDYCMNNFKNQWTAKDTYYDIIRNSIHNWVTELNAKLEDISKVLEDMKHD